MTCVLLKLYVLLPKELLVVISDIDLTKTVFRQMLLNFTYMYCIYELLLVALVIAVSVSHINPASQIKTLSVCANNFAKCRPIFKPIPPMDSAVNM